MPIAFNALQRASHHELLSEAKALDVDTAGSRFELLIRIAVFRRPDLTAVRERPPLSPRREHVEQPALDVSSVQTLCDLVLEDLDFRFTATGIQKYLYIVHPGYAEPLAGADAHDGPVRGKTLAPAMKELAQHFGREQAAD